jgi:hypothetical protein
MSSLNVVVKTLAGTLPPIEVPAECTVRELAERVRLSDPTFDRDDHHLRFCLSRDDENFEPMLNPARTLVSYGVTSSNPELCLILKPSSVR